VTEVRPPAALDDEQTRVKPPPPKPPPASATQAPSRPLTSQMKWLYLAVAVLAAIFLIQLGIGFVRWLSSTPDDAAQAAQKQPDEHSHIRRLFDW